MLELTHTASLNATKVALRPRRDSDLPFLQQLYFSLRSEEFSAIPWPESAKRAFLNDQFRLQDIHYTTHYPGATFNIIECDGQPIGRLYLFRSATDQRIIEISLLPEHRGFGIGTALLRSVIVEAAKSAGSVSLHVEITNIAAQRLYLRLGFVPIEEPNGIYQKMIWRE